MTTAQNQMEPLVNWGLGFEVNPKDYDDVRDVGKYSMHVVLVHVSDVNFRGGAAPLTKN